MDDVPEIFSQIMGRNHLLGVPNFSKTMEYMTAQASTEEGLADKVQVLNDAGWHIIGTVGNQQLPANLVKGGEV